MNKVIYASKSGNTKKLADGIARGVGVPAVLYNKFVKETPTDILFIGASIYAGQIDGKLSDFLESLESSFIKKVVVFGTSAGKQNALAEITSILEPKGIPVSKEFFHCKGSFLLANRKHPNNEDLKNARDFARKICSE